MCDISAVRNWLLSVLAVIGAAVSSSLFALYMARAPAYLRWLSSAAFATALALCVAAAALVAQARSALDDFCYCTRDAAPCAGPCAALKRDLDFVLYVLSTQAFLNLFSVIPPLAESLALPLVAVALAALGTVAAGIISAANLGGCQPARAGMPVPPPAGNGGDTGEPREPREPRDRETSHAHGRVRGLGDVVARLTSFFGVRPCEPCRRRTEALNAAVPFDR